MILALGFGSGIGIAFLISQLNPILIRPKQLLSVSDYPIWGTVTHLNIEQINKTNRNRLLVFLFSSGTILAIYGELVAADIMNIDLFGGLLMKNTIEKALQKQKESQEHKQRDAIERKAGHRISSELVDESGKPHINNPSQKKLS